MMKNLVSKSAYQFSIWQVYYWLFVSFVGFFTLTLWYGEIRWPFIVHIFMQALLGFGFSLLLCLVFMRLWQKPIIPRFSICLFVVLVAAALWNVARMALFIEIAHDPGLWADFGGWYYASIFIFLCWAGLFHGIRYYQLLQSEHEVMLQTAADARKEQMQRIQAQSDARDAQIKMLRYQLTPHFLCNTLNAISSLVELEESQKAQEMTVKLSQFLRHSLDNNPDTKVSLQDELKALDLYLSIEKSRFADRLKVDVEVAAEAQSAAVPSLLLQPIIENSMKYAISKNEAGGVIAISAAILSEQLVLEVSDTGPGEQVEDNHQEATGVGLQNTNQRLSILYGEAYTYRSEKLTNGGFRTRIAIPHEALAYAH